MDYMQIFEMILKLASIGLLAMVAFSLAFFEWTTKIIYSEMWDKFKVKIGRKR